MINLNHLHYFYVCAQYKSVTRAAQRLGISQPSLSQQLKTFELEVGERLFLRNGRTFELSARGLSLYEEAKGLFEIAEGISHSLRRAPAPKVVPFRIGVSAEIERPFVAELVGNLLRQRNSQNLKFVIISKEHQMLLEELREDELDLVITNLRGKRDHPNFEFEFPTYLVTSKDQNEFKHLSAAKLEVILQALNERLVLPSEGIVLREEVDALLEQLPSLPPIIFESNILACTVRAIRERVGCGFLPLPYIWQDYKKGNLSVMGPARGFWRHKIYLFASTDADELLVNTMAQLIREYDHV